MEEMNMKNAAESTRKPKRQRHPDAVALDNILEILEGMDNASAIRILNHALAIPSLPRSTEEV